MNIEHSAAIQARDDDHGLTVTMHVSGVIDDEGDLAGTLTVDRAECPVFCMGGSVFAVAPDVGETEQAFTERIWKSATAAFNVEVIDKFLKDYDLSVQRAANDMNPLKNFPSID